MTTKVQLSTAVQVSFSCTSDTAAGRRGRMDGIPAVDSLVLPATLPGGLSDRTDRGFPRNETLDALPRFGPQMKPFYHREWIAPASACKIARATGRGRNLARSLKKWTDTCCQSTRSTTPFTLSALTRSRARWDRQKAAGRSARGPQGAEGLSGAAPGGERKGDRPLGVLSSPGLAPSSDSTRSSPKYRPEVSG
jgi:hypothetical protein